METQTYQGGCHCGAVRYEVTTDLAQVITCNCSICSKSGTILTFVPEEQFVLKSGEDVVTDYQFNKKNVHHFFCKVCGIKAFGRGTGAEGKKMAAINVRCLDNFHELQKELKPVEMDGRNF